MTAVGVYAAPPFDTVACGELAGNVAATQLPNVPCKLAILHAMHDNVGKVCIGGAGVTMPNGSTDTTTGYLLSASESLTLPIDNLNKLYMICTGAGDDLTYIALS